MKRAINKYPALIGREKEILTLQNLLESSESELVLVIGRRRVGKTFLIDTVFSGRIAFELTGMQHSSTKNQLDNFSGALSLFTKSALPIQKPINWMDAFRLLILFLEQTKTDEKRVVFFDEMPWLATHRSGFLDAFGFFWNSWAVKNNIIVVICGSAASWMIQKVVHNKGSLYNRVTKRIQLRPFSLYETALFLQKRGLNLNEYQITELYMAIGGIPHYLKEIKLGESVPQNIDRICFQPDGMLFDEFKQLYPALFENPENHEAVVRALASKNSGLSRAEILQLTNISNGGGLTKTLEELQYSGFIDEYLPFGRIKRETSFRLTDEYSLFYLKFIEKYKKEGSGVWQNIQQTAIFKAWSGYAFESICLKHLSEIKKALGISGVFSTSSNFYQKGEDGMDGCQIDLLIDRNDQVINLCEIKWSATEFVISKSAAVDLRKKVALFKHYSKTKKQVFLTFISTFGLIQNQNSLGLIDKSVDLEDIFVANDK
jgi:uncharacterized protein